MGNELPLLRRFKIARAKLDHTIEEAACYLYRGSNDEPYTARWIAEAIKYPHKNEELHQSVIDYCVATEQPVFDE